MPALRDRSDDIPLLAEHFIAKASRKCASYAKRLSDEARECLVAYDWPGNVRELENALERALVLGTGDRILVDDLPEDIIESGAGLPDESAKFYRTLKETKKQLVVRALQSAHGDYLEAAKLLGMHPNSVLRLIRTLDLKAAVKQLGKSGQ
jgi:DNA-binding NtrC family response regulator